MKRQIFIGLSLALTVIVFLGVIKAFQISSAIAEAEARVMPPETVTSHVAKIEKWKRTIHAIGTLAPVNGATLNSESSGKVSGIHFESGDYVEKDQLLISLNTSVEEAELQSARAQLELATLNEKRQRALRKRNANSQSTLDDAVRELTNAKSEVSRIAAMINRKQIKAPYSGKSGIRLVDIGQSISADTPVVELHSYDPMYVNFSVPQKEMKRIVKGLLVNLSVDAYSKRTFKGAITAINSAVNVANRNIDVQATIQNKNEKLKPGMFVDVEVVGKQVDNVLAIPSTSINYAPYGNSVFIIGNGEEKGARPVTAQIVKLGKRVGDRVAILSGVREGDEIVSSGTFKLRPGIQVVVNNSITPQNKLQPEPQDS